MSKHNRFVRLATPLTSLEEAMLSDWFTSTTPNKLLATKYGYEPINFSNHIGHVCERFIYQNNFLRKKT